MNLTLQHTSPQKNWTGIGAVIAFHIFLVYGLTHGLSRKIVAAVSAPLQVSLIEEVKTVPPQPAKVVLPPKFDITPPPFIPPPEVQVAAPQNMVIASVAATPPPVSEPVREIRAPEPQVAAAPEIVNVGVVCPNHLDVRSSVPYPSQAMRLHLNGEVLVEFTVAETGQIKDVNITHSSNQVFNAVASNAVARFHCSSPGRDVRVRVPFEFRVS